MLGLYPTKPGVAGVIDLLSGNPTMFDIQTVHPEPTCPSACLMPYTKQWNIKNLNRVIDKVYAHATWWLQNNFLFHYVNCTFNILIH